MTTDSIPVFLSPQALVGQTGEYPVRIFDVSAAETYQDSHIPGAIAVDPQSYLRNSPPVIGLLPAPGNIAALLSRLGITPETRVIAYDDQGGRVAARLLWTLQVAGHKKFALLDGGFNSWRQHDLPVTADIMHATPSAAHYPVQLQHHLIADKEYILRHLKDPSVTIVDVRNPDEFYGIEKRAARNGHIPGAINLPWQQVLDGQQQLLPKIQLLRLLQEKHILPEHELIVHCHSHQRSAHTCLVLHALGYQRVRGYPGSWSDWASYSDTPVVCD
ncbi:MAG: sulfurtransferase [Gammaproteobacteria bacterium]|nr:sulfurtransferase [Gammaproteobacteria bacterium]